MSRIGKAPIAIPDGVKIKLDGQELTVTGPKGELIKKFHPEIIINFEENVITVARNSDNTFHRSLHGLTRALIANMVVGVTEGYKRELEVIGVGYRGEMKGKRLILNVGYSHPVVVDPPDGVALDFDVKAKMISVTGIDKELVGLTADRIRSIRKPEPYKGKGIRYKDEYVRRKAGKTAA
ncbi:MAG: 50S ribosomal protein L6 [FCB group bacterium]|nr:50S ribosomal protein L6 [FCB group bacterium]